MATHQLKCLAVENHPAFNMQTGAFERVKLHTGAGRFNRGRGAETAVIIVECVIIGKRAETANDGEIAGQLHCRRGFKADRGHAQPKPKFRPACAAPLNIKPDKKAATKTLRNMTHPAKYAPKHPKLAPLASDFIA